jgi:hypothetical protein
LVSRPMVALPLSCGWATLGIGKGQAATRTIFRIP